MSYSPALQRGPQATKIFVEGRYRKLTRDLPQTVFFCRVHVEAGTTAGAITELLRATVQRARHVSLQEKNTEFVPCSVRIEPASGFLSAPVAAAMKLNVRVVSWKAAGTALRDRIGMWQNTKKSGRMKIEKVWRSSDYVKEMKAPLVSEFTLLVRGGRVRGLGHRVCAGRPVL